MAENTFLGLQPYTEADAYRFKGRAEESQELFRLIVRNDYTVCYAESGEGKTSLLNAGVFPLLRQNMFFPIAITFTSDDYEHTPDNFDAIIDRCIKDSIADYNEKNKGINIEYKLCSTDFQDMVYQSTLQQELGKFSWWKLRNYKPQAMGLTFTPVFVFDQFEEVFNLPGSIVWTKKFFDWLEDVSSDNCPDEIIKQVRAIIGDKAAFPAIKEEKDFKAVFSLRKEFIGELDYWGMQQCFIPSLKDNRYCLKALTYEGAKKVMAQQQRFAEDKVEQVLQYFVQQNSREPEKTIAENLPVIPALLLSVVCDFWEKDIDFLSGKDVNEIGQSLNIILERFYDETLSSIVNELSQHGTNIQTESFHEDIETAIFALVDGNGKRVRRKSSELSHLDFDAKYKEILGDKRIIKISKIDGEDYVEIVHDAMCPIIVKKKELYLAEEAKKREKEKLREQAQKFRIRMTLIGSCCIVAFGIVAFVLYQMHRLSEANWIMTENQYRAIAGKAKDLAKEGDSYKGRILSSEILINYFTKDAPFCPEAEYALRYSAALQSHIMKGHTNKVTSATISPDGNYIASSSWDGTVIIWNVTNGHLLKRLDAKKHKVFDVSFSPDGIHIACAYYDGTIIIWNFLDGSIEREFNGHSFIAYSVSYSNNGKLLVSASSDNTAIIWDIRKGKAIHHLKSHNKTVKYATFSPDDKIVATASADCTIRLWHVETGKEIKKILGHVGYVNEVSFSPDGRTLLSAGEDRTIRLWNRDSGQEILRIVGHTRMINSTSFSSDGTKIVSGSNDNMIKIFDAKTGYELHRFSGHLGFVKRVRFILKDNNVLSSSYDGTVRVWDVNDMREFKKLQGGNSGFNYATFNSNNKRIVSAGADNIVRLWDINQNKEILRMIGHDGYVYCAAFSPDDKKIVSASYDKSIIIWDAKTGGLLHKLCGHSGPVTKAFFNPNSETIASASWDGTIRIWDAHSFKELCNISAHDDKILSISFSPNGKYIASCSSDKTVRVWSVKDGRMVLQLNGHEGAVISVSYSPNGANMLTASADRTVRIWDSCTGGEISKFELSNEVYCASYSPDGKYIITTSYDGKILVLDTKSGVEIEDLKWQTEGYDSHAYTSFFSPNGRMIVTSCSDYSIRVWDFLPIHQLVEETMKRFNNCKLTPEERRKYYLE